VTLPQPTIRYPTMRYPAAPNVGDARQVRPSDYWAEPDTA
jgi:hypothetical protein